MNGHTQNLPHDSICRQPHLHRFEPGTSIFRAWVASVLAVTSPVNWPQAGSEQQSYTRQSSRPYGRCRKPDYIALEMLAKRRETYEGQSF